MKRFVPNVFNVPLVSRTGVFSLLLALGLTACTATLTGDNCEPPRPTAENATRLVIYRTTTQFRMLYSTPISIDARLIRSLRRGHYAVYDVPEGEHTVRAEFNLLNPGASGSVKGSFKAGQIYYLRYSHSPSGVFVVGSQVGFTSSTNFKIVTKSYAESELRVLRSQIRQKCGRCLEASEAPTTSQTSTP